MHGDLSDLPLLGIFDLIHAAQQTGTLTVNYHVPYDVSFLGGELVAGGILDWRGSEALTTTSLLIDEGHFAFEAKPITGKSLGPYDHFMTEWARLGDEWRVVGPQIVSPSRYFIGNRAGFEQGASIRHVAQVSVRPLINVAQDVAEALKKGELEALNTFEWFNITMPPEQDILVPDHPISLFGGLSNTLGDLAVTTQDLPSVRDYMIQGIVAGVRFEGCGWVLRDMTWERSYHQ